jgi:Raf kinase inhibitor-like YbhB/YbcL family protein
LKTDALLPIIPLARSQAKEGIHMKRKKPFSTVAGLTMVILAVLLSYTPDTTSANDKRNVEMLEVTSPAFAHEGNIPRQYTCDGDDINPPIQIQGIPENTRSLALIMDDPDAPFGTWEHWLVWNISPDTTQIEENSVPSDAVLGTNSFKRLQYGGPCPPFGTHRYYFKVYALDSMLDLPEGNKKKQLQKAMVSHIIAEGTLMGRYARQKR